MSRSILLAIAGVVGGVTVALALFVFVFNGGSKSDAAPAASPTPVQVNGKLGPHITLADRVFNLQSPLTSPVYLKLQTIVEFETTSAAWAKVLHGCAAVLPSPFADAGALVSAVPGGRAEPAVAVPEGASAAGPCAAEEQRLLDEFAREIGTGRQLIEDAVTTAVTRHTAADLSTPGGKDALKAEIKKAVEQLIPEPHVTRVLFTNFITQ